MKTNLRAKTRTLFLTGWCNNCKLHHFYTMARFDIVIFGATGFTGQYVIEELVRNLPDEEAVQSWAVAGRSKVKLRAALEAASLRTGQNLDDTEIIEADVSKPETLYDMCRQAKVLLNCVGPYRFYGEPVVQACLTAGTHYLDLSGEPGFLDKMELMYDEQAINKGIYILGSCGYDTIPGEMGVIFSQNKFREKFKGDLNYVESFLSVDGIAPGKGGFNFGTWQSAVHCSANFFQDLKIHRALLSKPMPKYAHRKPNRLPVSYNSDLSAWTLYLPSCDESVIRRSQYFNYYNRRERPVEFSAHYKAPSILAVPFFLVLGIFMAILAQVSIGRYLLEEYPWLFSGGLFHKHGPNKEMVAKGRFSVDFIGYGNDSSIEDPDTSHTKPPNKKIHTRISGPELAYIATPIFMLQSAYTVLTEQAKMPHSGGVIAPGAAFAKTSLIERLCKHGITFKVLDN